MASGSKTQATGSKAKQMTKEQIAHGFNELRTQQRQLVTKMSEITDEKKEHQLVLDTLKDVNKSRTCYRMIGGVLVQKTVGEVIPNLETNLKQMTSLLETLEKQVQEKGKEILDYKEKHDIKLQSELPSSGGQQSGGNAGDKAAGDSKASGVLVNS